MLNITPYIQKQYVVYHTTYSGDKLPPNYIGSSNLNRITSGYKGSVKSKIYKSLWESELKLNPHLFSVKIISYHDTRREAIYKELQIQKMFNVITNPLFINMSYAKPNGFFGRDVSGINNPQYGLKRELSPNFGKRGPLDPKYGRKIQLSEFSLVKKRNTTKNTNNLKYNVDNVFQIPEIILKAKNTMIDKYGVQHNSKIQVECPWCNKIGGTTAMHTNHFNNCPKNPNYNPIIYTCPYCSKTSTNKGVMNRFHFENCKLSSLGR